MAKQETPRPDDEIDIEKAVTDARLKSSREAFEQLLIASHKKQAEESAEGKYKPSVATAQVAKHGNKYRDLYVELAWAAHRAGIFKDRPKDLIELINSLPLLDIQAATEHHEERLDRKKRVTIEETNQGVLFPKYYEDSHVILEDDERKLFLELNRDEFAQACDYEINEDERVRDGCGENVKRKRVYQESVLALWDADIPTMRQLQIKKADELGKIKMPKKKKGKH